MESLSSVSTIVRIAQEIAGAVSTVSRNRSRCRKLAKRVECIGDLLRELESSSAAAAGAGDDDDEATRRLLAVLEDALHRALELVTSCQDSGCPRSLIAGGRMAGLFDEVDGDIDRCLLELGVANRILITRLEGLLHRNALRSCDLAPPSSPSPATIGTETETTVTVRIGMPRVEHIEHRVHTMQGATNVASVVASSKDHLTDKSSAAPRGSVGVTDAAAVVASNRDKFTVKSSTATRGNAGVTGVAPVIASDKDKFTMRSGTATRGNTGVANVAPVAASNKNKFTTIRSDAATRGNARVTNVAPAAASNNKFTVRSSGATRGNAGVTNVAAVVGSSKNQFTARNGATSVATLLHEPPSNGYGYWPYADEEGLTTGESYSDTADGGRFDAVAAAATYHYYFPPFQHMFNEEDPTNACTIL